MTATVPRLLVLTDRAQIGDRSLVDVVGAAVDGGARGVVLREKDLPHDQRVALADEIRPIVEGAGGTFMVASDPTIASSGVHLAVDDAFPVDRPPLVGRSCHDADELAAAETEGCDYVMVARVFPSLSKPGYRGVLGPTGLAELCAAATTAKVVALGGLNWLNVGSFVAGHRPYGVALMGEVMRSREPDRAVGRVLERHPEYAA